MKPDARRPLGSPADEPWAVTVVRFALALVYLWFGLPKFFAGASPAEDLAVATVEKLSLGLIDGSPARLLTAAAEVGIAVAVVVIPRAALVPYAVLAHVAGACAPLLLFPEVTWRSFGVATLEGQYIIKNALIVASVCVAFPLRGAPWRTSGQRSALGDARGEQETSPAAVLTR
ncbi:hypothetical protein QOM21_35345 [Streptomyces sp. Pv4-95]|uniref:hypothetical protein n=1 Tax=Streptomyces sp. Pv4-95 TaxID=3049543 RepID=UPI0038928FCD